jgi:hypothetical protein
MKRVEHKERIALVKDKPRLTVVPTGALTGLPCP